MAPFTSAACIGLLFGASTPLTPCPHSGNIYPALATQAAQWPAQLANPAWKPSIGYLRESTGIAGKALIGPTVRWLGPNDSVQWVLVNAPVGMNLDDSERIVWPSPVEGRYLVRVQAQVSGEIEETDWYLNVLKTDFPDPVICSTVHMDYLVPKPYAAWMRTSGAMGVIDRYYEFGRDLVGGFPSDARQSMIYTPSMGGAHSGDPIVSGPFTFGDNSANRWRLGYLFHELGHDLNAWTQVGRIEHGDSTADNVLHDMVEFDKIAWVTRMLQSPEKQGVTDVASFIEWMKFESMEFVDGYRKFEAALPGGPDFLHRPDSGVWAGMIHEYAFTYGGDALERVIRAIRRDGIPQTDYPPGPLSAAERLTLVMCVMSSAAGRDLEATFRSIGMPVNSAVYARFKPIADKAMRDLPALGKNGMIRCPADGHYYCVTPYHTTWAEAESTARRMGGHLATIRSAAQEQWLANRFANDGWLWVGWRRIGTDGTWQWVTGENTDPPIWEPGRPETDPAKTCAVLIFHDDAERGPWFGLANRPPDENLFGIIEVDHEPAWDVDTLP